MSRRLASPKRDSPLLDELSAEAPELLSRLDAHSGADLGTQQAGEAVARLPLADVSPDPNQPRRRVRQEALAALAEDIARVGVLQPVVVRPAPDWNGYLLVFGERRFRAAQMAGLTHLPAIIRRDLSDVQVLEFQWQENAQREDVDDVDKALHLRRLKEAAGLSWSQLATRTHLTRRHLLRMQQIADMPDDVLDLVRERRLTPTHLYQLARLHNPQERQRLARQAAEEGWSVRSLEERVQQCLTPEAAPRRGAGPYAPLLDALRARQQGPPLSDEERTELREIARVAGELAQ